MADRNPPRRPRALEAAIGRFAPGARPPAESSLETMTPPAFRAIVAERLRSLERDLAEVRGRINGLLFVAIGAIVTQFVVRLIG
jgi:hypothetical protein